MNERDPLLQTREQTHGNFTYNAVWAQCLRDMFRNGCIDVNGMESNDPNWDQLPARHREALDAIALKLSRILSGQSNFKDHWDDIAGYAKLASEICDR